MTYSSELMVYTNVSTIVVPVASFNGRLEFFSEGAEPHWQAKVDFGTVGTDELVVKQFRLTNTNPYEFTIKSVFCNMPRVSAEMIAVHDTDGTLLPFEGSGEADDESKPLVVLQPGQFCTWKVEILTKQEEIMNGALMFSTARKESMMVFVSYRSMQGSMSLSPTRFDFPPSFPGRVLQNSIRANSSYSVPIEVSSIVSSDPRIVVSQRRYDGISCCATLLATDLL